jgi:hypothetical protein
MGRISSTINLAKQSWEVLKADQELIALPVLSFIASTIVAATFVVPMFFIGEEPGTIGYVVMFVMYVVLAFVTVYFNTALVSAADERLRGGDPTIGSALSGANRLVGRIIPWALISATVSIILRTIEERGGFLGRIAAGIAGLAWTLVTFLVIPIFVVEGLTVGNAVKRSAELFKRTWGENVAAQFGFGLLGFLLAIPAILIIVLGVVTGSGIALAVAILVGVLWLVAVSVVLAALNAIFQTALYHYAANGQSLGPFGQGTLSSAFRAKASRGLGY